MTEPVSQCRLQSIRVKKGEVWFKKEEVTTIIIYLLDIIVLYKKVHGSWLTLFMMSPLMFGIGISLSTSSSMSKTMAIACRRYKGEREAGCEQVIFYFNKIFLRHWLISIFIFFQSSTKRWLPLTYHQAYLRLCRTSVRVATALCAVDLKGSGGPGKGNVSVDWERSLKKEEKYFYINAKDGHCAPRLTLESPSCEHWIVTIFSASAMIVFVLYYLCMQSLVFRRAQGEERDGKKRKERKRGKS